MSLPKPSPSSLSVRALLTIGGAVALVHWALLQTLPPALQAQAPIVVRPLSTRSIAPPPPPVAAPKPPPPAPAAVAQPRPRPGPKPVPAPDNMAPAATSAMASEDSPPTVPAIPAVPEAPASAPVEVAAPAAPPASAPEAAPPPTQATAFVFPDPVRLRYELNGEAKKLSYHASGELLWLQDGQHYDAKLEASMLFLGSRTRTSTGTITHEGLAPTRFSDKWRSERAAHFDHTKNHVSFSANTPDIALQAAAQDQLSVVLQLAGMLAADPARFPPASTVTMQTIGPKDADTWIFTVVGAEKIHLPTGEMQTQKLIRNPRKEFDQKVEIWLSPALGYLPVRLKITNANGDFVDQQLRKVEKP